MLDAYEEVEAVSLAYPPYDGKMGRLLCAHPHLG